MQSRASGSVVALRQPKQTDVDEARKVLRQQSAMLQKLADRLDGDYTRAVDLLEATTGHVVVTGVGKSGIIAHKIASTFASTGTPALALNSAEAFHGDLGMITGRDTAVLLSRSGETTEVVRLLPHLRRLEIPIIALVGEPRSSLARGADVALDVSVDCEACPNNLAPTSSTLAALALGDALAIALVRRRGFTARDFARLHPGGRLGRDLTTRVREVMRRNDLPVVAPRDTVGEALIAITGGRLGLALVVDGRSLVGIVTDGDLRRGMQRHQDLLTRPIATIMTKSPVTISEDILLTDAHERMKSLKIKALVVVDTQGAVSGIVEVFDDR